MTRPATRARRDALLPVSLVVLTAVALAVAVLVAVRPVSTSWEGPGVAPGSLRFADLMVMDALETPDQLAALRADCRTTRATAGPALAAAPATAPLAAARTALAHYLDSCRAYDLEIGAARGVDDVEDDLRRSYRFSGAMRASDGVVYTCGPGGVVRTPAPSHQGGSRPTCWSAERTRWPVLAGLISVLADLHAATAAAARGGCALPGLDDVCAAYVAREDAAATSLGVFAAGLTRGDTRVFDWLGVPASVGVAEQRAAEEARAAHFRSCRDHGLADGSTAPYRRDRMREWAASVGAALTGRAPP